MRGPVGNMASEQVVAFENAGLAGARGRREGAGSDSRLQSPSHVVAQRASNAIGWRSFASVFISIWRTARGSRRNLPDLLEGPDPPVVQAETKPHDLLLASSARRAPFHSLVQQHARRRVDRYFGRVVLDEVREAEVLFFADRLFQGDVS